ncbi:MAG: hypothetical protein HY862_01090 [Chloroflexi bacterium]|nr:hypothetical protein [Chloroflexota bacterium]
MQRSIIWLLFGSLILVACGGQEDAKHDTRDFTIDSNAALTINFDDPAEFETGTFEDDASLAIEDGQYVIRTSNPNGASYLWGKNDLAPLKNVVIEVQATSSGGEKDNWFGVMCRVDDTDSGYAFLISADGFWAIAKADGQRGLDFLETWKESKAIEKGGKPNTIQAYCVEDYLALYVNGEFVADRTDKSFDRVGGVGLLAGGAQDQQVEVHFDTLTIKSASFENKPNTATPSPAPSDTPTATSTPTEAPQTSPTQVLAPVTLAPLQPIGPTASTQTP